MRPPPATTPPSNATPWQCAGAPLHAPQQRRRRPLPRHHAPAVDAVAAKPHCRHPPRRCALRTSLSHCSAAPLAAPPRAHFRQPSTASPYTLRLGILAAAARIDRTARCCSRAGPPATSARRLPPPATVSLVNGQPVMGTSPSRAAITTPPAQRPRLPGSDRDACRLPPPPPPPRAAASRSLWRLLRPAMPCQRRASARHHPSRLACRHRRCRHCPHPARAPARSRLT